MMPDRDTTKRMFTHMINMMEQHDTMTISCGDPLMELLKDVRELLKEQEVRIQKYEYVFDFLGIGFRQWATKILDGEAEAICETDEHGYKTVVTFKLI